MHYRIIFINDGGNKPIEICKDTREGALSLAKQLRKAGYSVDVWKQTEDETVVVETDNPLMPKAWLEKNDAR